MGILLQANLSFGVALDDEQIESLPWDYEEGSGDDDSERTKSFEDWLKEVSGVVEPFPYEIGHDSGPTAQAAWDEWMAVSENKAAYDKYSEARSRAEAECPIKIVDVYRLEEDGESACIMAVKSSVQTAMWQGGPNPLAADFTIHGEDINAAKAFCERHNLPFDDPKWLVSVCR
jgi:hypothetical protein